MASRRKRARRRAALAWIATLIGGGTIAAVGTYSLLTAFLGG